MQSRVFRKSWPNYVPPLMALVIIGAAIYLAVTRYTWLLAQLDGLIGNFVSQRAMGITTERLAEYVLWAGFFIFCLWAARTVLRIFWLWTFRIQIGENGISASAGGLPCNKWNRTWEPDQIFDCLYEQSGLLNWLARHGNLVLTGREGTTNRFVFQRIGRVKKACEMVNSIRYRLHG